MSAEQRVVIVGAGLSGLATAHAIAELARGRGRPAPRVTLLERDTRAGGKVRTDHVDGYTCEWGPAGFLDREPATLALARELGVELLPASALADNRYLYVGGGLQAVQIKPLAFLRSPILSWRGKLRLAGEPFAPARPAAAEDESVASFARRRIGDEAFTRLIDAMQSGIYAGDPERMSVAACFPRVVEVEREHGSLIWGMVQVMRQRRRERRRRGKGNGDAPLPGAGPSGKLTSCPGGLQRLTDALVDSLEGPLEVGAAVRSLSPSGEGGAAYTLETEGGARHAADAAVLACPSFAAADLVRPLDAALGGLLAAIDYAPMVVACLGYPRQQVAHALDGFGFLAPRDQRFRPLGALFSSTIFPERAPEGRVLLRVMMGGARDRAILEHDDPGLAELACQHLAQAVGARGEPEMVQIFRHERAIPQYELGHNDRLARIDSLRFRHAGLFVTGNAYRGIGVNDCVKNAWIVAKEILDHLG